MKTLQQARAAYEIARKGAAARNPLVRAVLDYFPGSEIVAITDGSERSDVKMPDKR